MKSELRLLNLICLLTAVGFIALVVLNAIFLPQLMTTDNLFVTMVCLVMAVVFGSIPLIQMKSEGRLPIPFQKRFANKAAAAKVAGGAAPPLPRAQGGGR